LLSLAANDIEARGGRAPRYSIGFAAHRTHRGVTPRADAPVARAFARSRTARAEERRARAAITSLALTVHACDDSVERDIVFRALDAGLVTALADIPASQDERALRFHARTGRRGWRFALRAPIGALTGQPRVLAGAIFPDRPHAKDTSPRVTLRHATPSIDVTLSVAIGSDALDPRRLWLTQPLDRMRVRWLTEEGLPKCLMGSVLDGVRVLLTPRPSTHSLVVDADGRATPAMPWPATIVGELHNDAWHIAWAYQPERQLLARRPGSSDLCVARLDVSPFTAAWVDSETVVVSTNAGLWRWTPGQAPQRIADVPPSAIVAVEGNHIQVDPIPLSAAGGLARERRSVGWTVDRETGRVEERTLGWAAQAWSRASCGDLVATTHPDSDMIRLDRRSTSEAAWLAWPSPRGVAWMGEALMVWGTDGAVGLLPGCSGRLSTLLPTGAASANDPFER
jgi:hypothetical protein